MRKTMRSRPSPALVVAVVALVAALAGTAVAGPGASSSAITKAKVKKVATKQINKRLPWKTADIADAAVTSPKLADAAVTSPKLGAITTRNVTVNVDDGTYGEGTANCQAGERAISGGAKVDKPNIMTFAPIHELHKQGEGWYARVFNGSGAPRVLTVEVYCLA